MLERIRLYFKLKPLAYIGHWRQRLLGQHARAVLTDTWNGLILTPPADFFIGRKLAYRGAFDKDQVLRLFDLVTEESDVLFVGAHLGTALIPVAKKCRSVVGVEANPRIFELLKASVLLNGLDNVQLLNVAAANEPGELRFIANAVNSGGGKVAVDVEKRFEFFYDSPDVITVEAARLDDVLNGKRFDLIIVDIEGSEYRAFKGMPETLSKAKQLIVELAPNHIDNVAHVSREEFLDAIPDSFSAAALLHGKESYTRSELLGLFEEIWEEDYYGSLNLLFVAE